MVAWAVKDFGGQIPRADPRNLPDNMAEQAVNCDLTSGPLDGLPSPLVVQDLSAVAGTIRRAYRFPGPNTGDPDVWLPLPSEFSSVCRSPLANDTLHRLYWTNPGQGAFWSTYTRIAAGNTPYNLGFTAPSGTPTLSASGGTTDGSIPLVERSYLYTFIDEYGLESSPSNPSSVVSGASDGTWTVGGLPTSAPGSPAGKTYPNVSKIRLYRTVVGTSTGGEYYQVADLNFGSATYADTIPDTTVTANLTLQSTGWAPAPDGLDGLIALPGGMLVGFSGNTVHFCEPDRPHAWPPGYDQSVQYPIVALALWNQTLVILTSGFPSNGSGSSPANFVITQLQVPEPCIARGSVVTDLAGVYYASQNGLIMLNYFGMVNQTLPLFAKNIWTQDYHAASIIACRHRAQYLAINGTGAGFLIDYTDPKDGVVTLNTFSNAVCVWNDVYTGDAYIIADKVVYRWDDPTAAVMPYRWRSKEFYLPAPGNIGAFQVSADPSIETAPGAFVAPLLNDGDPSMVLPDGVNAQLHVYAEGTLVLTKTLNKREMVFRGVSGFKAYRWQFEIVALVAIHEVQLASTMEELRTV